MIRRYGYYLADGDERHGDADLSARAERIWKDRAPIGEPTPYDGCSIWETDDDGTKIRLVVGGSVPAKDDRTEFA